MTFIIYTSKKKAANELGKKEWSSAAENLLTLIIAYRQHIARIELKFSTKIYVHMGHV